MKRFGGSGRLWFEREKIASAASLRRMSSISIFPDYARSGGLLAYGPSLAGMFRRAARYVDAILKGQSPGELPIERPTSFLLVVNQKIATTMELRLPPSLLARADEVI